MEIEVGPRFDAEVARAVPIPWGLVAAISVDGAVDGLLIGLSFSVSSAAGITMAIATW